MSFDHKTAADLASGRPVPRDKIAAFVQHARWTYDDRELINAELARGTALNDAVVSVMEAVTCGLDYSLAGASISN